MRRWLPITLLLVMLVACSAPPTPTPTVTPEPTATATSTPTLAPTPTATSTPRPTATPTPVRSPTPTPAPAPDEQRVSLADAMLRVGKEMPGIRQIPPTKDIQPKLMTRAELRQRLVKDFQDPKTVASIKKEEALFKVLRLIGTQEDLLKLYVTVYGEEVGVFFDTETGGLYVVAAKGDLAIEDEISLAHEVTHALQQQNFNTRLNEVALAEKRDAGLAFTSVVEGDAVLSSSLYAIKQYSQADLDALQGHLPETPGFDAAPPMVQQEILFPYTAGTDFVGALYQRDGATFKTINAALQKPPSSTAEILHPQRSINGTASVAVTVPELSKNLGAGWTLFDQQPMGEMTLRILLSPTLGSTRAINAGTGWAGDTYGLYARADGTGFLALRTVWDNADEATQFFDAYSASLGAQAAAGWRRFSTETHCPSRQESTRDPPEGRRGPA